MKRIRLVVSALVMVSMVLAAVMPLGLASAAPFAEACGPTVTHVVVYGENLFRISLGYGTTMAAIAAANGISNYTLIYAGQTLRIPCAGAAPVYVAPPPPTTPYSPYVPGNPPASRGINCDTLRLTSPLDGMGNGNVPFYWDPVAGATGYRVNIYNLDPSLALVGSFDTGDGAISNLTIDTSEGSLGWGIRFAWEVQALVGGLPVCTSERVMQLREWIE